ncbi:MAG: DUF4830 domain-containing protein [Ruminiclostridium sp.]|nr:DUF4830 domain-containing protein [Ruminiclostridium sp.]
MMKKSHFIKLIVSLAAVGAASTAVITALNSGIKAESAADAADYLATCGLEVIPTSEKEVTIPTEFGAVYERYNALQKAQGFDLSAHRGHSAVSYTFTVVGRTDTEAHVLVCDGKIVAGDVASTRLDGEMTGLKGERVDEEK